MSEPAQATYVDADGQEQTTEGAVFALCRIGAPVETGA
jgi:hypothetical protein